MKTIEQRVTSGINWLNKVKPGWEKRIHVKVFNIANCHKCVCGQIFGNFGNVMLGSYGTAKKGDKFAMSKNQACNRGFFDTHNNYDALQKEWLKRFKELKIKI